MVMGSDRIVNTSLNICKRCLEILKDEERRRRLADGKVYSERLCRVLIRNTKTTLMLSLSRSRQEYSAASWPNVEVQILKIELTFRLSNSCRWARANNLRNRATRNPGTAQLVNSFIHMRLRSSKSSWWRRILTVQDRISKIVRVLVSTCQASSSSPPSWTWHRWHRVWAQEVFEVLKNQTSLAEAWILACNQKIHMANLSSSQKEMELFS